jgi:hypothetical protein
VVYYVYSFFASETDKKDAYTRDATVTLVVPESSSPPSARGAAFSSYAGRAAFCIARLLRKA